VVVKLISSGSIQVNIRHNLRVVIYLRVYAVSVEDHILSLSWTEHPDQAGSDDKLATIEEQ
jgi:hypothetical protein